MQDLPLPPQTPVPPTPTAAAPVAPAQGVGVPNPAVSSSAQSSDPLAQASEAIDHTVAQTTQNPHARSQAIAAIKEAYLKARFGA